MRDGVGLHRARHRRRSAPERRELEGSRPRVVPIAAARLRRPCSRIEPVASRHRGGQPAVRLLPLMVAEPTVQEGFVERYPLEPP